MEEKLINLLLLHIGFKQEMRSNVDAIYSKDDYIVGIHRGYYEEIVFWNKSGSINITIPIYEDASFKYAYNIISKHFNMLPENRQDRITKLYEDKRD